MKIVIDTRILQQQGVIDAPLARVLEQHAIRSGGSTAINLLIAFGVVILAAGALAFFPTAGFAAFFGAGFCALGLLVRERYDAQWSKLAAVWSILGALLLSSSVGALIDQPMLSMLAAAVILAGMAVAANSALLAALAPLAVLGALGGSTGYWHACYSIAIEEPFMSMLVFTVLAWGAWKCSQTTHHAVYERLSLVVARMSVIVVNMAFWIGSLWGSKVGQVFGQTWFEVDRMLFVLGWAVALVYTGIWAAKHGRRFVVNTVAVFGSIHFYTQWFELLHFSPLTVMVAGASTIGIGLMLWRYNRDYTEGTPEVNAG